MKNILIGLMSLIIVGCTSSKNSESNESRDPYQWPFSQQSIWNMPIGSNANYVPARIEKAMAKGMTVDEDLIVMKPEVELMHIFKNYAGWDRSKSRCTVDGELMFSAPIPKDFLVSPDTWDGSTPNSGLAVLMSDKRTIKQTQPFSHCEVGDTATSQYTFEDEDLYGNGMYGAHGGSGLSAIGGALRIGELTPESGPVRHVLKVNLFAKKNLFYDEETKGHRWPAKRADGYAEGNYYTERTKDTVKACRMGSLLALPSWMNLDSLEFETEPARILAQTFKDYGAYVVDDTAWDVYAFVVEWGPDGRFTEEFEKNWGFSMNEADKNTPWARDMDRIFLNLHVVDNNSPTTIGGGGVPLQPLAPELTVPE